MRISLDPVIKIRLLMVYGRESPRSSHCVHSNNKVWACTLPPIDICRWQQHVAHKNPLINLYPYTIPLSPYFIRMQSAQDPIVVIRLLPLSVTRCVRAKRILLNISQIPFYLGDTFILPRKPSLRLTWAKSS